MEYIQENQNYILRLEKGEEVNASLEQFMKEQNIAFGFVKGLGALEDVELGYYELHKKEYIKKIFPKEAELLSLMGNLSTKEGKAYAHTHIVLGDENFNAYGGHMFSGICSVTVELFITSMSTPIKRIYDDNVGLALLSCKCAK